MTDSMKYLWLLLREDSSYIFMLMLVIVTTVVMSFFCRGCLCPRWGKSIILIMCIVVAITEVLAFLSLSQHTNRFKPENRMSSIR